jgi:tRNA pseudouridine38-40 synthase
VRGYVLKIAYQGKNYCGWQVQPDKPTVQACVQSACESLFGVPLTLTGCSRTDSGVHAREFVALLQGDMSDIPAQSLPLAINTHLPDDVSIVGASVAREGFHPRYDAIGKEYIYRIRNSRIRDPFCEDTSWLFPRHIDEEEANRLCKQFVGRQDFRAFMAAGSKITDTVRTVTSFDVTREGDMLTFRVSADGFLYNMVRIMVGTVAERASGTDGMPIDEVIASGDRSNAGVTAPAKGLFLNKVFYPYEV